jgi:SNF2 family DNA or RNA helicase
MELVFHLAENPGAKPFAFLCTEAGKRPIAQALTQDNLPEVVDQLAPLIQESRFAAKYAQNNRLFHAIGIDIEDAYTFLCEVDVFKSYGIGVKLPDLWAKKAPPKVTLQIDLGKDKSDLRFFIADDGKALSAEEMEKILSAKDQLLFLRGRWVEVDSERLRDLQQKWHHIVQMMNEKSFNFLTAFRIASGMYGNEIKVNELSDFVQLRESLHEQSSIDKSAEDLKLTVTLRPYQKQGIAWLLQRYNLGIGSCLADDMGLGKTLQILCLIRHIQNKGQDQSGFLIVAPSSLLENWYQETKRFFPDMRVGIFHSRFALDFNDITITSYSMVLKHFEKLAARSLKLLILDEAQVIKNPMSQIAQRMKKMPALVRIALTGTPIENSKVDLWSIFEFVDPQILGDLQTFLQSPDQYLKNYLKYFVLRRLKSDPSIVPDLPAKVERTLYVSLTAEQQLLYKTELDAFHASSAKGLNRITILGTISKLKQICNHPDLYKKSEQILYKPEASAKLKLLIDVVTNIINSNEKFIVFSHYVSMLEAIRAVIQQKFNIQGEMLSGSTPISQRQDLVTLFQHDTQLRFMCLSLKAAGVGLNLTAANHVIHYDRWWNPAVEDQASDRSFRIGQRKNVQVYYLVNRGTIESGIEAILKKKREVSREMMDTDGMAALSQEELLEAMSLYGHATF